MLRQLIKLRLILVCLLPYLGIAAAGARQNDQAKYEQHQHCLCHPSWYMDRTCVAHKEDYLLPLLAFCFTCGRAGFLTTPARWFRHSWHSLHSWYTPHTSLTCELRPLAFASAHLANHGAHFAELFDQLIDILDCRTTSTGDTFAPAPIENLRIAPLLLGHGEHHRFDMFHLVAFQRFFHLWHRCHFVEAWHHFHHLPQRAHSLELAHRAQKIFQVKLTLLQFGLGL